MVHGKEVGPMPFTDRTDAGRRLAQRLAHFRGEDVVVLALPRGGVPVAFEVAQGLDAPLDVIVVRKLGLPFQPELAMGAIGEGVRIIDHDLVRRTLVSDEELAAVEARERAELDRRARRFRGGRAPVPLAGRTAIVVDDGIATGSTARAACQVARARGAARVVLAVPVGPTDSIAALAGVADEVVCLEPYRWFLAIGQFYDDFSQTPDEQVLDLLERAATASAATAPSPPAAAADPPVRDEAVEVPAGAVRLAGHLTVPEQAIGAVVFAHGSGSSRHSPRNRYVAAVLNDARLATLLFDLLTPAEELDRANVFDIDLLAHRLVDVTTWLRGQPEIDGLPIGYFGASTGAAAALLAAADAETEVAAVVSRGGRPDLAGRRLGDVYAPTLLIVGGHDAVVLALNREAQALLAAPDSHLAVVPGATHLFDEPGALSAVAELARGWFIGHFAPTGTAPPDAARDRACTRGGDPHVGTFAPTPGPSEPRAWGRGSARR
jgi:putative phosphoribosyl transferase